MSCNVLLGWLSDHSSDDKVINENKEVINENKKHKRAYTEPATGKSQNSSELKSGSRVSVHIVNNRVVEYCTPLVIIDWCGQHDSYQ